MLPKNELVAVVDIAFDKARENLGVETDEALAQKLGISQKTISFFRNGRWTTVDEVLISVLIGALRPPSNHISTS
jgi:ribosome-binding protein aMBF1 (putative translation factor)